MKVGIYLGFGPQISSLKTEGLGRFTGYLIDGFLKEGHEVVIACPRWMLFTMQELLDDLSINDGDITYLHTKKIPPIWRLKRFVDYVRTPRKKRPHRNFIESIIGKATRVFAKEENIVLLIGEMFISIIVAILFAILYGILIAISWAKNYVVSRIKRTRNKNIYKNWVDT